MKYVVPITLQVNEIQGYSVLTETSCLPQGFTRLHGQTELQLCHDYSNICIVHLTFGSR